MKTRPWVQCRCGTFDRRCTIGAILRRVGNFVSKVDLHILITH